MLKRCAPYRAVQYGGIIIHIPSPKPREESRTWRNSMRHQPGRVGMLYEMSLITLPSLLIASIATYDGSTGWNSEGKRRNVWWGGGRLVLVVSRRLMLGRSVTRRRAGAKSGGQREIHKRNSFQYCLLYLDRVDVVLQLSRLSQSNKTHHQQQYQPPSLRASQPNHRARNI